MDSVRIDSRAIADTFRQWVQAEAAKLRRPPCLATVLNSQRQDPGSVQYRNVLLKDARKLGIETRSIEVEGEAALARALQDLNNDDGVQGIVVLYPLGLAVKDDAIMDWVSPRKDIEGLHSINLGYLIKYRRFIDEARGLKCVVPATAKAAVKSLMHYPQIRLDGAFVTIVNNSMRVGKPLGLMLENLGATVVKCYDRTPREALEACVRRADIVVTAVPDPNFKLDPEWVKVGAAVVDVSFQGNIDVAKLDGRAALLSAPDNRIGKITRAMMFVNLIYCCQHGEEKSEKEKQEEDRLAAR
jgi:5,10-methylene-tetrahydrofolate dehydrogenase/methenyl tetrahydrofolate cyclohydrolase